MPSVSLQVDEELARLTTPEAHYALNAHLQETLEDVEPLTLQEPLDSPKRKEWIKGMRSKRKQLKERMRSKRKRLKERMLSKEIRRI